MSWIYKQSTGELSDPTGKLIEKGYAGGDKGQHPEGRNNPAYQFVPDVGPLPQGTYTVGTPVEGSHLGPLAIPLIPDPANDMRGRKDFFCHGDHIGAPGTASDGCIIMSHATRALITTWQHAAVSSDQTLQVIA